MKLHLICEHVAQQGSEPFACNFHQPFYQQTCRAEQPEATVSLRLEKPWSAKASRAIDEMMLPPILMTRLQWADRVVVRRKLTCWRMQFPIGIW